MGKAVKRFEAIFILRRDYEDVQEKLIEMRQQIQSDGKGAHDDLKDLYFNALKAMVNGAWLEAEHLLLKIKETRFGYLDTEQYLQNVQNKISQSKKQTTKEQNEYRDKTSAKHDSKKTEKSEEKVFATLPSTISIETVGGVSTPIFYKGDMLPLRNSVTFSTAKNNQTSVEVHLVLGENKEVKDNKSLGKFILDSIAPAPKGVPQIEIFFTLGRELKLEATAIDKTTNRTKDMRAIDLAYVKPPPVRNPLPAKDQVTQSVKQNTSDGSFDDLFSDILNKSPYAAS